MEEKEWQRSEEMKDGWREDGICKAVKVDGRIQIMSGTV